LERAKKICGKIKKMKYGGLDEEDMHKKSSWSDWRKIESDPRWIEIERGFMKLYELYKEYERKYPMTERHERMNEEEKERGGTGNIGTMVWSIEIARKLADDLGIDVRVIEPVRDSFGFGGRISEWAKYDLLDLYYNELKKIGLIKQSRRFGRPRTNRERLRRHKRLHPEDEVEDIEDLPPRGTGLKRRNAVDPYVDIDHVTDTFLEWAGNPRKGADLTDELIDYFAKYKVKMEHRKPLINNLKGMGYKVDIDELKEREML